MRRSVLTQIEMSLRMLVARKYWESAQTMVTFPVTV